jgi:hypothetical protein
MIKDESLPRHATPRAPCGMDGTVIPRPGRATGCPSPDRSQGRGICSRIARGLTRQPLRTFGRLTACGGRCRGVGAGHERSAGRFPGRAPGLSQGRFGAALLRNDSSGRSLTLRLPREVTRPVGGMGMMRGGRAGAVLLEVMVALAILGVIASTAAWRTAEWMHTVHRAHTAEAQVRDAQRLLTAVSLWPREDLDRHLGARPQGAWMLSVDRASPELYRVTLRDTASRAVALRTTLYRAPEP